MKTYPLKQIHDEEESSGSLEGIVQLHDERVVHGLKDESLREGLLLLFARVYGLLHYYLHRVVLALFGPLLENQTLLLVDLLACSYLGILLRLQGLLIFDLFGLPLLYFVDIDLKGSFLFILPPNFLDIQTHEVHLWIVLGSQSFLFYQIHLPKCTTTKSPHKLEVIDGLLGLLEAH